VAKGWKSYLKGVSAGGEEFTSKFEKQLPNGTSRPTFLHGTLKQVLDSISDPHKPLLLYLSDSPADPTSLSFETTVLTNPQIIKLMVSDLGM
jgi:hypothetical protein